MTPLPTINPSETTVGVIGLGTIGLPLATFAAIRSYNVIGFDIDHVRINQINERGVVFEYSNALKHVLLRKFHATADPWELIKADILIFCVPTPVDKSKHIDLTHLQAAAQTVAPYVKEGALIILESSVEVGTTNWFNEQLFVGSARNFDLAYCPERYDPTIAVNNNYNAYTGIARIVGGITSEAGDRAQAFYSSILIAPVTKVSSPAVAEAAKLLENIFRDVNIAFVNEFTTAMEALNVDTYEVIDAASTKDFAFLRHVPGLVGGECIPVDTWYLIQQAEKHGIPCPLMHKTRETNDCVVNKVGARVLKMLRSIEINQGKITILGTAYKANVYDDRVSPSYELAEFFKTFHFEVALCDPVVKEHNHRTNGDLQDIDEALHQADAVVLATAHDAFLNLDPLQIGGMMRHRVLYDVRNCLNHDLWRAAGFTIEAWGRHF